MTLFQVSGTTGTSSCLILRNRYSPTSACVDLTKITIFTKFLIVVFQLLFFRIEIKKVENIPIK
jgi:hypothetical protein